ncbi:hypothetical protein ET495_08290 [Xylanimonas allomyrinae]|uniref:Uncharacterized protein n=1 Tax=Xylanimonas allomyrinae TaxID=2509459 RepID=A0A4P6ENE9_9MICO|nr:hypothetical protein ET495_08290 [Xylanimonas allomyrinae]
MPGDAASTPAPQATDHATHSVQQDGGGSARGAGTHLIELVRRIGFAVAALAAIVVFVAGAPAEPEATRHDATIAAIEADDNANNARTEGAPQQQVVNGWTTIAYLGHISDQVDDLPGRLAASNDGRPAALLLIGVLTAAFHLGTKPSSRQNLR